MFDDKTLSEPNGDDAILSRFREWQTAHDAANRSGMTDEERDAACDVADDLLVLLAEVPTTGAAGIAAKFLSLVQTGTIGLQLERDPKGAESRLWLSLIEDCCRLAPELASIASSLPKPPPRPLTTDEEMLAAERELAERRRQVKDSQADNSLDPVWEIYDRIMGSEPESFVGIAVKMRVLLDPEIGLPSGEGPNDVVALRQVLDSIERHIAK